jgi:hypothetical protein
MTAFTLGRQRFGIDSQCGSGKAQSQREHTDIFVIHGVSSITG